MQFSRIGLRSVFPNGKVGLLLDRNSRVVGAVGREDCQLKVKLKATLKQQPTRLGFAACLFMTCVSKTLQKTDPRLQGAGAESPSQLRCP